MLPVRRARARPLVRELRSCMLCSMKKKEKRKRFRRECMRACSLSQSCPTLCDPTDCGQPGSSVSGIFQAGILEWVAVSSSSRGSSRPRDRTHVSCISCTGRQILCPCTTWEAQYRPLGSTDHELDQNNHNLLVAYCTILDFMHSLWYRLWGNTKMFKVATLDCKFHED